MRFSYPYILLVLIQSLIVLPLRAQQRSGIVDGQFNAADEGYADLMAGTSEMQYGTYASDWYTTSLNRITRKSTVVLTDPKGAGAIFDSTGRLVASFPCPPNGSHRFVPFEQLPDGSIIGYISEGYSRISIKFQRRTLDGELFPGYDTSNAARAGLIPLFAFPDGRLLYRDYDDTALESVLKLLRPNGTVHPTFSLLSSVLRGDFLNSRFFQIAPDRVAFMADRRLTVIDTSGRIISNYLFNNPFSAYITGKLVYASPTAFYVQVSTSNTSFVYKYQHNGRTLLSFAPIPIREGDVVQYDENSLINVFADSLRVYDLAAGQWTIRRKMPQDVSTELPIPYDLANNAVIFPSLRVLAGGPWGAAGQSLYHVKPDNSLDLALQRRAGYGPFVGGVMQVNDSTLFLDGVWRANGIQLPGKGVTVDRNTGAVRLVRFPFTQLVMRAADDDSYYLSDSVGDGVRTYVHLNAQAQPHTQFYLDSTQPLSYSFFPRRGGGAYSFRYSALYQADFKPILSNGHAGTGPSYQILNQVGLIRRYLQAQELSDGGWVLFNSLSYSWPVPPQSRILVLDSGVVHEINLPTTEYVKAVYPLPNSAFALTCHSYLLNWTTPRKTYYFNPDHTPNDVLTTRLGSLVLVGTQSDGGLLLCDDQTKTIYRHLPDGSPDPYWNPLPFEGSFVNFYNAPDDQLYAYGAFYRIGGVGRTNLAKIDSRLATHTASPMTERLVAYPSPAFDQVQIILPKSMQGQLTVTDIAGRIRYKEEIINRAVLSVQGWAPGVYQATVLGENGAMRQARFVVR